MKKRNKKYNPKQIVKQKVHKFQMTWEVNEAKRIIEMHHLLGGVDPQESTHKLMLMGQGLGVAA